jgi:cleavage and polyadenylation specificity factor subunit 3
MASDAEVVESLMDNLSVLPLGSGGEVGRSCVILTYKGRKIMLDCGIHPAKDGLDSLPHFDSIECGDIDIVLITHFHLDHCGALPYFCEQTPFKNSKGRVFMTGATKAFYRMVMEDLLRVGSDNSDIINTEWLHSTIARIETVEYHQEVVHNGIRFQPFNAGHVLGAAMFMIDIAGVKTLYTGDYSREPDRHLFGAESPPIAPDVLIVESTYGRREHEPRENRENKFISSIHEVVARGGRCLIPVFALGRAQELLLILEEYWEAHQELHHIPVYYASSLAAKCMKVYKTYVSSMNQRVGDQHKYNKNPFVFKHIQSLADLKSFNDSGPSVVLASPGMLQSGISLELFDRWCGDRLNGIVIAGYCVDGTIADKVLQKKRDIELPSGRIMKVRMETIESVSFSAHADARQTRDFIQEMQGTGHIILVHGNEKAMEMLKDKLTQDLKDRQVSIYTTRNQEAINIPFSTTKIARVMGSLAANGVPKPGEFVSGVLLVSEQHGYTIVHPREIPVFTGLDVASVQHAMILPLGVAKTPAAVLAHLKLYFSESQMFADVQDTLGASGETDSTARISVIPNVDVEVEMDPETSQTTLSILWTASRRNDLVADVTCIALTQLVSSDLDDNEANNTHRLLPMEISDRLFRLRYFHHLLTQYYISVRTDLTSGECSVTLENGEVVQIHDCIDIEIPSGKSVPKDMLEKLKAVLKRTYLTLFPIPEDGGWCECGMMHTEESSH